MNTSLHSELLFKARLPKVLVVDDEELNLELVSIHLRNSGYKVFAASDGELGMEIIHEHPDIEVIILDRKLPKMDGIALMKRLKNDERFRNIPVIMQTAAASTEEVEQGIEAGVFYYLPKPYDMGYLLSVIGNALRDFRSHKTIQEEVRKQWQAVGLMEKASFRFRTMEEAANLCYLISNRFPVPETIVFGLHEAMCNSIEHGNLGITYEEKKSLLINGGWQQEIRKRSMLPEYCDRYAILDFEVTEGAYVVTITDQGKGFEWEKYMRFSPQRATDPNGRGIIQVLRTFSSVEYQNGGSRIICTLRCNAFDMIELNTMSEITYSNGAHRVIAFHKNTSTYLGGRAKP